MKWGILKELNCQSIAHVQNTTKNKKINHIYQLCEPNHQGKLFFTSIHDLDLKDHYNWADKVRFFLF